MPDTARALSLRFAVVFSLTVGVVLGISYLMIRYTSFSSGSIFSFLPIFIASLDAGRQFFRRTGRCPKSRENRMMAAVFTVISLIVSVVLGLAFMGRGLFGAFSNPMVGVIFGVLLLLTFLSAWFFFRLGAKFQSNTVSG